MSAAITASSLGVPRELYPWEGAWLDVGGARLHYLDEGPRDGDSTLLMVHGNPSWSFYWRALVHAFSADRRCVVPDHVGMGLSDKPGDAAYDYTLSRRVKDLDKLVQRVVPTGKITLVAHDWGGMIGMGWAVANPDRVERIILLNTSAFLPAGDLQLPWQLKLARSPLGTLLVQGMNAFAVGAAWTCTTKPLSKQVRRAYTAPYRSFSERISTLRFVQDIGLSPDDRSWAQIEATDKGLAQFADTPILIHWGLKDFVFHKGFLEQFRARWPHALIHEHAAGHYVLEDEADAIIASIRSFLAAH